MKRVRPTTLEPISATMFVIISLHVVLVAGGWWWWKDYGEKQQRALESQLTWMSPGDFKSTLPQSTVPKATLITAAPKAKDAPAVTPPAKKKVVELPVQKATLIAAPPQQHQMEPVPNEASAPLFAPASPAVKAAANRSITLRRAPDRSALALAALGRQAPPMTSPTLLDIARLNTMRPTALPPPGVPSADDEVNLDAVDEALNAIFLAHWIAPPITEVPVAQRGARMNISIGKDGTVLKSQMSKFSGSHALDQSILEASAKVKKIPVALPSNYSKDSYDLELNFLLLP